MTDLKSSIENTDADLNDLNNCVDDIYDYQMDPEYVTNKLIDWEDRPRRNNLRVDDISESRNGTWEECEEEIQKVFNEKLCVKNVKLKEHIAQRGAKVTTIVCKLFNYKQKEEILRNTKTLKKVTFLSMSTFVMKRCNTKKNYGKKSKIYEVKAKLPILIINQFLWCQIKAIQGK